MMTSDTTPTTPRKKNYLMWFRRDLRLHDNTALTMLFDDVYQTLNDDNQLPNIHHDDAMISALYTITPQQWLEHNMSLAQMDFIFRTLKQLASTLFYELGVLLHVIHADTFDDSIKDIEQFCIAQNITHLFANIEYEINEQERDKTLATKLAKHTIEFNRYHDQCILPPNTVKTNDDSMYKVFTPFYKKWQTIIDASSIQIYPAPTVPDKLANCCNKDTAQDELARLLADIDNHHQQTLAQFKSHYQLQQPAVDVLLKHIHYDYPAGERHAQKRLDNFIKDDISDYTTARDKPAVIATSQLSAYLTVGSISARLCYQKAHDLLNNKPNTELNTEFKNESEDNDLSQTDVERWISELAWRDFYRHVIVDRPDIVKGAAYQKQTDSKLNWSYDTQAFNAWCQGKTGVPLIDAAMRCLNQTGFMHNRLRMVTAMFLTKDLFVDWRWGERYFMQQLIDGDFASNNGGWQWSASTGTDAAPYFRIMNPFSQAKTHDKDAIFIKTWLPELKDVPATILHNEDKLRHALNQNGEFEHVDYPAPMVEHKKARLVAIEQFKTKD